MGRWVKSWTVESDSSSKDYTVSVDSDGTYGCSCLAWTRRRIECKHIKKVKGMLAEGMPPPSAAVPETDDDAPEKPAPETKPVPATMPLSGQCQMEVLN